MMGAYNLLKDKYPEKVIKLYEANVTIYDTIFNQYLNFLEKFRKMYNEMKQKDLDNYKKSKYPNTYSDKTKAYAKKIQDFKIRITEQANKEKEIYTKYNKTYDDTIELMKTKYRGIINNDFKNILIIGYNILQYIDSQPNDFKYIFMEGYFGDTANAYEDGETCAGGFLERTCLMFHRTLLLCQKEKSEYLELIEAFKTKKPDVDLDYKLFGEWVDYVFQKEELKKKLTNNYDESKKNFIEFASSNINKRFYTKEQIGDKFDVMKNVVFGPETDNIEFYRVVNTKVFLGGKRKTKKTHKRQTNRTKRHKRRVTRKRKIIR